MKKVAIAGLGTIGLVVAKRLDAGIEGLKLVAVSSGNREKAEAKLAELSSPVPMVSNETLATLADIIVDCAPTKAFDTVAESALKAGRTLVTVSGAAILKNPGIVDVARAHGGRIVLATGALLGLDAVRAAAEGNIHSIRMRTAKPPKSLVTAEYVVKNGIDLSGLTEPLKLFSGTAREGAMAFPANVNVAAALGLAGVGADRTELEIWADPALERNTHTITVDADSASFELRIQNIPTDENPGTGRITALSVIAAIKAQVAPLHVGT
ncbi:aspartate dehydrogenase [Gimibacter soli]|uniref:L-aspartate dehydrogenase n=1 Tax=Gimibacter soli TaxID=3024400 RepID=A0AAE9XQP3_9PROT|nr:aspartate dehydrogenase [Gimibacter soli]WCL53331.1 aspartate dehydrogenase [Gimibacter soli]